MKPVVGLILAFTGLAIGYMVITGKLPSGQAPTKGTAGAGASTPTGYGTGTSPSLGIGANLTGGSIKIA